MRTVIEFWHPPGSVPIEDIRLNAKSRDDTPALPVGIQAVYRDEALRNELFALLDEHILPDRRRDTGHPGMDLVAASTHKSPFDACRLRFDVCDSIRRIDKPRLQFIELCNEKEAKPFKLTVSSDRRVAARQRGFQITRTSH